MTNRYRRFLVALIVFLCSHAAWASLYIPMYLVNDSGPVKKIGYVKADDTIYGLLLTPKLKELPPGIHGFHIHQFPSCASHGTGAGGHLDPTCTQAHRGPYSGDGHLGDLPVLIVDKKGRATLPVLAPRLKLCQIQNRALMIHMGGDNYSDNPQPLGGGGARIACGVIGYAH
jgi:Cu-Zn family superoxide dismutase